MRGARAVGVQLPHGDAGLEGLHHVGLALLLDQLQLILQALLPEAESQVRHVCPVDVVLAAILGSHPTLLRLLGEAAYQHAVPGQLAQVCRREPVELLGDRVLLHQRLLRLVELQRIIRTEAHVQAPLEELMERALLIGEEQVVVGARRHPEADLAEVVQVLQGHGLPQVDAVVDGVREQEGRVQVVQLACLARMRPVVELRHALGCPQTIHNLDVGLQVIIVVLVGGVVADGPVLRLALTRGEVSVLRLFALRLIINGVEPRHLAEEFGDLRVLLRIQRSLDYGKEDIVEHLLEAPH
mmetsp:Transcript_58030/g.149369  ORF Transcript_58030/g.149369 Transcript_58030/m.149369 type:complete len:298 (-) Transcript_58030:943-1836(-)